MALQQAPFYWLTCDTCGAKSTEHSDYSAWADHGEAEDEARDSEWLLTTTGEHYCSDCRPDLCTACHTPLDPEEDEHPDTQGRCPTCHEDNAATRPWHGSRGPNGDVWLIRTHPENTLRALNQLRTTTTPERERVHRTTPGGPWLPGWPDTETTPTDTQTKNHPATVTTAEPSTASDLRT